MMDYFDSFYMDYQGQKNSENIFQIFIVIVAVIGFIVGYVFQQFSYTMFILGAGCIVGGLLTLPSWPMYRRHPIKWQIPVEDDGPSQSKSKK